MGSLEPEFIRAETHRSNHGTYELSFGFIFEHDQINATCPPDDNTFGGSRSMITQ